MAYALVSGEFPWYLESRDVCGQMIKYTPLRFPQEVGGEGDVGVAGDVGYRVNESRRHKITGSNSIGCALNHCLRGQSLGVIAGHHNAMQGVHKMCVCVCVCVCVCSSHGFWLVFAQGGGVRCCAV